MTSQAKREMIDDLMDVYVDWREECAGLALAYERWASVPAAERGLAFAAYRAALDREQQASSVYAERSNRVARELAGKRRSLRQLWRSRDRQAPARPVETTT